MILFPNKTLYSSVCFFDHDYMIIYIHDFIYT